MHTYLISFLHRVSSFFARGLFIIMAYTQPYVAYGSPAGEGPPQTIRWGEREFWVMPKPASMGDGQSREARSALEKYDASKLPEFKYNKLPKSKKRIRLLQLQSGTTHGPEIHCSLVEADYDNEFHIPTTITGPEKGGRKSAETTTEEKDGQEMTEEEKEEERKKRLDAVLKNEIPYEALSWHWGSGPEDYMVRITQNDTEYKKRIRKELGLALKYLRLAKHPRVLWVDSICIDQSNDDERSQQVQMMSRIYTRSKQVTIWLGEDTDESKLAIDFINNEIMHLNNFDTLCSDKRYSDKWRALMSLMQREWFSRRWVVQEIALANKARLYCGPDSISWKALAVAVELFVEVETATHRLSEIMKKDEKFLHIPGWFDHVSELGASLLVQATGRVFRAQRTPLHENSPENTEEAKELRKQAILRENSIDPLDRRSLLSLEYLVSTLFIFKASEPRDTVYSLLGIARDATPFARSSFQDGDPSLLVLSVMREFLEEKPFVVDYARPYSDVCRDYVEFTIRRKFKLDPVQALDVLCRPWALDPPTGKSIRLANKSDKTEKEKRQRVLRPKRDKYEKWTKKILKVEPLEDMEQQETAPESSDNSNDTPSDDIDSSSSSNPSPAPNHQTSQIATDPKPDPPLDPARFSRERRYVDEKKEVEDKWDKRDLADYWRDAEALTDKGHKDFGHAQPNWRQHPPGWEDKVLWYFPIKDSKDGEKEEDASEKLPKSSADDTGRDLDHLPSWVALASHAPFTLYPHTGMGYKAGRSNADPLVGQPQDGHRNYSAAQTNPADLDRHTFKFHKRQKCNHYSLYVRGFELDTVVKVLDASQSGNIPKSWLDLGGWNPGDGNAYNNDPPDDLWRTLVADRGRDNRNPPYYYATACKESVQRGGIASGSVNTSDLINNHRNSIVAEFCRRVQAVIWSRHLFMTKRGKLGLARSVQKGDKVCILYGCTVPVIVREVTKGGDNDPTAAPQCASYASPNGNSTNTKAKKKTAQEIIADEDFDDAIESLRSVVHRLEDILERKARYRRKKAEDEEERKRKIQDGKKEEELGPTYEDEIKKAIRGANKEALSQLARQLGEDLHDDSDDDGDGSERDYSDNGDAGSQDDNKSRQSVTTSKSKAPRSATLDPEDKAGRQAVPPTTPTAKTARSETLGLEYPLSSTKAQRAASDLSLLIGGGARGAGTSVGRGVDDGGVLGILNDVFDKESDPIMAIKNNKIVKIAKMSGTSKQPIKRYTEEPVMNKEVYYEFKGEAYVHGMMDGEALRIKLYENLKEVVFELR
ncbi:Heterokaryon incompatibility protein (HET) domain containing protein [Rhypophila decipiens]